MARTKAADVGKGKESSHDVSEDGSSSEAGYSSTEAASKPGLDAAEPEYHTVESDGTDAGNDEDFSDVEDLIDDVKAPVPAGDAPLLPAELLKPLPSPAYSLWDGISIPWSQMTREQKRAERLRSRRAAKREWDRFNWDADGVQEAARRNGVLDAGKAAQLRRKTKKAQTRDKTRSGRVQKASKPHTQLSGREKLLHTRRTVVEQNGQLLKRSKNTKKALPKR